LALLIIAANIFLPGAVYLFLWPFFFSLIILPVLMHADRQSVLYIITVVLLSIPAFILLSEAIHDVYIGLTLRMPGITAVLIVVMLSIVFPLIEYVHRTGGRFLMYTSSGVLIIMLILGGATSGFDENHPKPNSIVYALDTDIMRAVWATCDVEQDEWTSQFFKKNVRRRQLLDFFPFLTKNCLFRSHKMLQGDAPALKLVSPYLKILSDRTSGSRKIRMKAYAQNGGTGMMIAIKNDSRIKEIRLGGQRLENRPEDKLKLSHKMMLNAVDNKSWIIIAYQSVPRKGIEFSVNLKKGTPLIIRLLERKIGLPDYPRLKIRQRPKTMMSAPAFIMPDSTLITKLFRI